MNSKLLLAAFTIAACAVATLPAADPALPIALVNIDRILKDYKPLNDKLDPLKAEAKEVEAAIQVRQAELEAVGNQLRQILPGSPDQQRLQIQLVKMQGDFQRFVATSRNNLQNKEGATYLAFFRQLDAEISKYCKANGLKLVLRQQTTSLDDGQSLQDIFKALNRQILYEEGLDITDAILKALQASSTNDGTRNRSPNPRKETGMIASHQWTWSRWISLLFAIGIVFAAWNAISDERPAADAPHKVPVALLDVAKVFKNCREFNDKMNQMKVEIDQFDREMRKRAEEMQNLFPNDTGSAPSSSVKSEQLASLKAAYEADVKAKKQLFLAEEARVYADIYAKIEGVVAQISRTQDVGLVLRFTSDPIDPADRPSVLQGVNKPVVYSAVPDLTTDVVAALNGEKF